MAKVKTTWWGYLNRFILRWFGLRIMPWYQADGSIDWYIGYLVKPRDSFSTRADGSMRLWRVWRFWG